MAKKLWEFSEKQIEQLEKEGAVKRALAKKEAEKSEKKTNTSEKTSASDAAGLASSGDQKQMIGSRRNRKAK